MNFPALFSPCTKRATAIWSNQNTPVAWVGKSGEPQTYTYGWEELYFEGPICSSGFSNYREEYQDPNIMLVNYNTGKHVSKLERVLDGEMAAYFQKRGRYWYVVGIVCHIHLRVSADEEKMADCNLTLNCAGCWESDDAEIPGIRLATNKADSLAMLGWKKPKGKGTGNLNHGVCTMTKRVTETWTDDNGGIWVKQ
jgi:hypothetical protein